MIVNPGTVLRLGIIYIENGAVVTGLTDLTVTAKNAAGVVLLANTGLVEEGTSGEYIYMWNTTGINLEEAVTVYYKKGSVTLDIEQFYFDVIEDQDGKML